MIAYHGQQEIKDAIIAQLEKHCAADEIVKGQYWKNGKGCAVGCTLHSADHIEYENRFGIPQNLAYLEDCIFEGLPNKTAMDWPIRFMDAVKVGTNLSCVGWQFLHWILTDENINPGIKHPLVRGAVQQCADLLVLLINGASGVPWNAAENAAESAAESAARSAARSAESAYEKMASKLIELIEVAK